MVTLFFTVFLAVVLAIMFTNWLRSTQERRNAEWKAEREKEEKEDAERQRARLKASMQAMYLEGYRKRLAELRPDNPNATEADLRFASTYFKMKMFPPRSKEEDQEYLKKLFSTPWQHMTLDQQTEFVELALAMEVTKAFKEANPTMSDAELQDFSEWFQVDMASSPETKDRIRSIRDSFDKRQETSSTPPPLPSKAR